MTDNPPHGLSSIYHRKRPEREQEHVARLQALLGPCVLLNVPRGEKGCNTFRWQRLGVADMTPRYLSKLNHDGNIGVSLGRASGVEEFLELNPALQGSLISKSGSRGVWLRMRGEWRANGKVIHRGARQPSGNGKRPIGFSEIRWLERRLRKAAAFEGK
jgi:hypothetical protein